MVIQLWQVWNDGSVDDQHLQVNLHPHQDGGFISLDWLLDLAPTSTKETELDQGHATLDNDPDLKIQRRRWRWVTCYLPSYTPQHICSLGGVSSQAHHQRWKQPKHKIYDGNSLWRNDKPLIEPLPVTSSWQPGVLSTVPQCTGDHL